jgi:hypothetical protein
MEEEQQYDKGRDKDHDRGEGKKPLIVPGDAPIIVGGGGSTWIWIKKDSNPQLVNPADPWGGFDPPDNNAIPPDPENFYLFHLADVSIKKVVARNGIGSENNQDIPQGNPNAKKKHHTFFQKA